MMKPKHSSDGSGGVKKVISINKEQIIEEEDETDATPLATKDPNPIKVPTLTNPFLTTLGGKP